MNSSPKIIFDILPPQKPKEARADKNSFSFWGFRLLGWGFSLGLIIFIGLVSWAVALERHFFILAAQEEQPVISESKPTPLFLPRSENLPEERLAAKKIEIDLDKMILRTYSYGEVKEYPIAAKGPPAYPTPRGSFQVLDKEPLHFSSKTLVWMPWSLHFYGDYFIHETPYWPNGKRLEGKYSGGCIRLNIGDAKQVYDFAEIGTPVIVY